MSKRGAVLFVFFVLAMIVLMVGAGIKISKIGNDNSQNTVVISGIMMWGNIDSGGWEIVGRRLSNEPPFNSRLNLPLPFSHALCRECTYEATLRVKIVKEGLPSVFYESDVLEVISIKQSPHDH